MSATREVVPEPAAQDLLEATAGRRAVAAGGGVHRLFDPLRDTQATRAVAAGLPAALGNG
jgi:hypothetical protein